MREDNERAVAGGKDGVRHAKHISIRKNFVRENATRDIIKLSYCPTAEMTADIFTKPLPRISFEKHRENIGVLCMDEPQVARRAVETL